MKLASAPESLDPQVRLRKAPASKVAAITVSGFWSRSNHDEHLATRPTALRGTVAVWAGEPVYSRCNARFTPWFMRRNEIWLPLR